MFLSHSGTVCLCMRACECYCGAEWSVSLSGQGYKYIYIYIYIYICVCVCLWLCVWVRVCVIFIARAIISTARYHIWHFLWYVNLFNPGLYVCVHMRACVRLSVFIAKRKSWYLKIGDTCLAQHNSSECLP